MDKKHKCGFCGKKMGLDDGYCVPQDSVYICESCYKAHSSNDNSTESIYKNLTWFMYYDK